MKNTAQIRVSLSAALHQRLETQSNKSGLSIGDIVRNLIATHIKPETHPTTTAKPAAQPRRALTPEERLFGMAKPEEPSWLPSEEEMEQRRKAVLAALE